MYAEAMGETLTETVTRVFERAAFVICSVAPAKPWRGDLLESRLRFRGPLCGWLVLAASHATAARIAANVLGTDGVEPEHAADCLGELLNMLAGSVTDAWFGSEQRCVLGLPETKTVPAADHERLLRSATISISLVTEEGEIIEVLAVMDPDLGAGRSSGS